MLVLVDLLVYNCIAPMIHVPVNTDRCSCTSTAVPECWYYIATSTAVPITKFSTAVAAPPVELQLYLVDSTLAGVKRRPNEGRGGPDCATTPVPSMRTSMILKIHLHAHVHTGITRKEQYR